MLVNPSLLMLGDHVVSVLPEYLVRIAAPVTSGWHWLVRWPWRDAGRYLQPEGT